MKWNFKLTCLAVLATPVWSAASRVVSADMSLKEAPSESSVLEGLGQAHPWQQRTVRRTRALCDPASLSWPLLTSLPQTLLLERAFSHGRRLLKGTCYSPCVSTWSTFDPPTPQTHSHLHLSVLLFCFKPQLNPPFSVSYRHLQRPGGGYFSRHVSTP